MNEIDNDKMALYSIVFKVSDTQDQMLSTTFCDYHCFDTHPQKIMLLMRKSYRSLDLADASSILKSETDQKPFFVNNSFLTTY